MTDTDIYDFDMPEDDDFDISDFMGRLDDFIERVRERANRPPVEMEPVYLFLGIREQPKNMSEVEIIMHSSFLGFQEVQIP